MKLHYSQTNDIKNALTTGFTTLWNHTILKRVPKRVSGIRRFTTLWNHTILKLIVAIV